MTRVVHSGSRSWFLPIPDPGSRGQKGTGFRIQIRNIGLDEGCVHLRGAVIDWRLKSALAAAGLAPASSPACGSAPALRRRTKLLFFVSGSAWKWCSNTKYGQCCGSGSVSFWASWIRIRQYLYGSGSFHYQAENERKPWFLLFSDFFL
jgi:hypothetical protein